MRILLVSPPGSDLTTGLKHLAEVEPWGLEVIGAPVPDHQVELLDMEIDTDLAGTLRRFQPDISAGPLSMRTRVRIGAHGVTPEHLREIVEWAEAHSPVGDVVRRAVPSKTEIEIAA